MRRTVLTALLLTSPIAVIGLLALIIGAIWEWTVAIVWLVGGSIFLVSLLAIAYQLHLFYEAYKAAKLHETLPITEFPPSLAFLPCRAIYYGFAYPRLNNTRNNEEEEHLPPFRFPDNPTK